MGSLFCTNQKAGRKPKSSRENITAKKKRKTGAPQIENKRQSSDGEMIWIHLGGDSSFICKLFWLNACVCA